MHISWQLLPARHACHASIAKQLTATILDSYIELSIVIYLHVTLHQGLSQKFFSEGAKKNDYCSHTFSVQSMLGLQVLVCPHRKFLQIGCLKD